MGAGTEIYARATGYSALGALIGSRCYPGRLPEGVTLPALAYRRVGRQPDVYDDHEGPPERAVAQFQLDCYGNDEDEASVLADRVEDAFDHYQSSDSAVGWCSVINRIDSYEPIINRAREIVTIRMDHVR